MSNVTNLLNKIKLSNDQNTIQCYVPSINTHVESKQLSVKQQKDIIRSAMDGSASGVTFSIAINNILRANIVNSDQFLSIDRSAILLAIRAKALGTKTKSTTGAIIDFADNLNKTTQIDNNNTTVTYEGISVLLTVPTISRDQEINLALLPVVKEFNKQNEIGESISNIYVYEIAKFITNITFDEVNINTKDISIKDIIKIVESFPTSLNNLIIDFIKECRKPEELYLTVGSEQIALDANFFTAE